MSFNETIVAWITLYKPTNMWSSAALYIALTKHKTDISNLTRLWSSSFDPKAYLLSERSSD